MDWEVWIQKGDQPWPRKLVIIDRTDPARPTFTARLSWQLNPAYTDADLTFVPDANAKRIQMANYRDQLVPPQYLGGMAQMARLFEREADMKAAELKA